MGKARLLLLIAGVTTLLGCAQTRPTKIPLDTLFYGTAGGNGETLIVFLPGYGSAARDFEKKGFIAAVRKRAPSIDVLSVDAHFGYYKERNLVERLRQDAIDPAMQSRYEEIWIVGTSMGGLGAVLFAREYPEVLKGIVLLSPYLGPGEIVTQIEESGGLSRWSPSEENTVYDQLWSWLKGYDEGFERPELIIAFGERDRLNPAHEILAAVMPSDRVFRIDGGHGWRVWKPLWDQILTRQFNHVAGPPSTD